MPTAWKIRDKGVGSGSGPTWGAMSSTDYEDLIDHKWDWASDLEIFAKSTSDTGIILSAVSYLWADDPTTYRKNPWTIMNITKIQEATET